MFRRIIFILAFFFIPCLATAQQIVIPSGSQMVIGSGSQIWNPVAAGGGVQTPAQICGANLVVWYEAETATCSGSCTNNAGVSGWTDKSANANNMGSGGGTVTYLTSQINGKAAVYFNNGHFLFGSPIPWASGQTVFIVSVNTSTAAKGDFVAGNTGSFKYWTAGSSKQQGADVSSTAQIGLGTAAVDENWHQMNATYDGTTLAFRLDRASDGGATNAQSVTASMDTIGASHALSEPLYAEVAALVICNGSSYISGVETYLNSVYGK